MLDQETVRQIISRIPLDDGVFLAGGQALNFWAEHYAERAPELQHYGPFTSKDVDFFGRYQAAEKLAQALGGFVEKPAANSPENFVEAIVVVRGSDGDEVRIDFLNYVLGTNPDDLEKRRVELRPGVLREGQVVGQLHVPIMHPFHVLQSRIANVIKLDTRSTNVSTRQRQARAAPIILREYVRDRAAAGQADEVRGILEHLYHWLRKHQFGQNVRPHVDYDPLEILLDHRASRMLDERWLEHNLARWIEDIVSYRQGLDKRRSWVAERLKNLGIG